MENRKLLDASPGGKGSGLSGGEVAFFHRDFPVFFQKSSFNEKMIGRMGKVYYFFLIGIAHAGIGDISDFLAGGNRRNFSAEIAQNKRLLNFLFRTDGNDEFRLGVHMVEQGRFKRFEPRTDFKAQGPQPVLDDIDMELLLDAETQAGEAVVQNNR